MDVEEKNKGENTVAAKEEHMRTALEGIEKEHFEEVATLKSQMPEKEQQFANEIFKKERDRINATA